MKRIITCSDGTWNRPGEFIQGKPVRTNVQKMFQAVSKYDAINKVYQLKHYDEGVGSEGNLFTRIFSAATGKGIDENILSAYKFIMWNYEPGDEIYLFGFSRGAYTARSIAGLIRNCGILRKMDLNLIKEAYAIYRNRSDTSKPGSDAALKFKADNSYEVLNIKFIGVWDTVGALGIPINSFQIRNKHKYAFHDTTLSSIVDNAFHALSIDEKRGNFQPALWTRSQSAGARNTPQTLEQRWFAGTHSNVGGGYLNEGLSDIALKWLVDKSKATGLVFEDDFLQTIKPNSEDALQESYTSFYRWIGKKYIRPIGEAENANEDVAESAIERYNKIPGYKPLNLKNYIQKHKAV